MITLIVVLSLLLGASAVLNWHLTRELRFYAQDAEVLQKQFCGSSSKQAEKYPGFQMPI